LSNVPLSASTTSLPVNFMEKGGPDCSGPPIGLVVGV